MINILTNWRQLKIGLILFFASLAESIFWLVGKSFNVYTFAVVGAVFELLALPMLVGGLAIIAFSIFTLMTNKQNRVLSILSLIILIVTYKILV